MKKDIVYACLLLALHIKFYKRPKYESENAWVNLTMFLFDIGSRHAVKHIVAASEVLMCQTSVMASSITCSQLLNH